MSAHRVQSSSEELDRTFEPETIVRVVWRRKGWLLAGLLQGLGANVAMPRTFQSTAQIPILRQFSEAILDSHSSPMDSIVPPTEVLRSPAILETATRSRSLGKLSISTEVDGDLVTHIRTALTVVPSKAPAGQGDLFRLSYRERNGDDCQTINLGRARQLPGFPGGAAQGRDGQRYRANPTGAGKGVQGAGETEGGPPRLPRRRTCRM